MSSISVAGDVSGAISIAAPSAAGSGVLTLPVATDTLIGKATTDTLTNKSIAATQLTGTIAAAALPAGSVIQVVNGTYATQVSSSTSTYITTGLTASITPRSTSSKILVFANVVGIQKTTGNINSSVGLRLYRGASSIIGFEDLAGYTGTNVDNSTGSCSTTYLDSPATTSSTTYTVYFASVNSSASVRVQNYSSTQANATSTITLMEIQG
jgi:hypothetical protein